MGKSHTSPKSSVVNEDPCAALSTKAHRKHVCFNCDKKFRHRWCLNRHLKNDGCGIWKIPDVSHMFNNLFFNVISSHALGGCVSEYKLIPRTIIIDEKQCIEWLQDDLNKALLWLWNKAVMVKWGFSMEVRFYKLGADGERSEKDALFFTELFSQSNERFEEIPEMIKQCQSELTRQIEKYSKEGSGWILLKINYIRVHLYRISLRPFS